jgi:D-2-hydroxyacid dehydrogenase (NADP+)
MTIKLPEDHNLCIHFAHPAFKFADAFGRKNNTIEHWQSFSSDQIMESIANTDILVLSGFWDPELLNVATRLKWIHVNAAGYDQFDLGSLQDKGVMLTNSRGAMANAVAEHAIGMMLSFTRKLFELRGEQLSHRWRSSFANAAQREDELDDRTLLIYGLGTIGSRLAELAKAFNMKVIGIKRDVRSYTGVADEVYGVELFEQQLPRADFVALTCSLSEQTRNVINQRTLSLMSEHAILVNVARGGCVNEADLIDALRHGNIGGAALDCTVVEPLAADSRLWDMPNTLVTPHSAGDTRRYEDNVVDILLNAIKAVRCGESPQTRVV